jgi:hypothetical protein
MLKRSRDSLNSLYASSKKKKIRFFFENVNPTMISSLFGLVFLLAVINGPRSAYANSFEYGEVLPMGNGVAWSWVEYDGAGKPVSLGVSFTETALEGLPEKAISAEEYSFEHILRLPQKGLEPYTHIGLDWNPAGHIPPGIYDLPHFDVHFFIITPEERDRITLKGNDMERADKKPEPQYLPGDYILPEGTGYPRAGVHWIDPQAPEFNKQQFMYTFIYGTYDARLTFLEPMVSLEFLRSKQNVSVPLKVPEAYQKSGFYPAAYSIKFSPVRKEYTISLDGLSFKKAR